VTLSDIRALKGSNPYLGGNLSDTEGFHAMIPTLIADAGDQAVWRYIDFFTSNIRNPNTRRAYARACGSLLAWAEERGRILGTIRPYDVSLYIESRQQTHSPPDVKQQLAAIRMLFDWLITGQILPHNPAAPVRGPKHVVKTGKTPVLDGKEWRKLLDAIPTVTVRDLRDRALIATLTYFLRPDRRGTEDESRGSSAEGRRLGAPVARKWGETSRHGVPSFAGRGIACLHRCRRHRRGQEGVPVPHLERSSRRRTGPGADGAARRVADDPKAGGGGWHFRADRQSFVSGDRDYSVSRERRRAGTRAGDGGTRKPAHHEAV
jgi:hypothetical protein